MAQILHYTIGPVQSFVGQARRTRDLWAGSFILSWMAGQAMYAIIEELQGKISFPVVQDDTGISDELLKAIMGDPNHNSPQIGSLPNRFKATFREDVAITEINGKVTEFIKKKWLNLGNAVWDEFVKSVEDKGVNTKKTWQDQMENFWEINWVLGEEKSDDDDGSWLDIRKNWRSHWPIPQGGDHCTLMGDWQELSGHIQTPWQGKQEQLTFWQGLQKHKKLGPLELRDSERLCAISLIKRLFPRLSTDSLIDTIGWVPGGNPKAVGNWPSTSYMAAIPWLNNVIATKNEKLLYDYAKTVNQAVSDDFYKRLKSEQATNIHDLNPLGEAAKLDGNLFHFDALDNHRATPLSFKVRKDPLKEPENEKTARKQIRKKLQEISKVLEHRDAQPFYALLLMDGDNMGKLLQNKEVDKENTNISASLMAFTQKTAAIVDKHQGILLYAGGDDVLAMVSMQTAIECARELHETYTEIFAKNKVLAPHKSLFTASASIVYAHFHAPLKSVLQHGHQSLDNIAKETNRRNSLVLTVLKPEGITAQWVARFSMAANMLDLIDEIKDGGFSTSFFYNLKARYPNLHNKKYDPPPEEDKEDLLLAEYCKGKNLKLAEKRISAQRKVQILLRACGYQRGDEETINLKDRLQLDGMYAARFLVDTCHNFGRERGQS